MNKRYRIHQRRGSACLRPTTLPGESFLELVLYYGKSGEFKRVVKVASEAEARTYLQDKSFHSAELFETGADTGKPSQLDN